MTQAMALAVQNPQIDVLGAYDKSRANQSDLKSAAINQAGAQQDQQYAAENQQFKEQDQAAAANDEKRKGLEGLATVSLGVLRGDPNGKADPAEWDQAVNLLAMHGADPAEVAKLRGHPEMANVLARMSMEGLKALGSSTTEVAPGASLLNNKTGQVIGTAPVADKPASLPTSYQEFQLAQQNPDYAKTLASSSSKPPTDAQRRAMQLTSVVKPDADLLLGDGTKDNPGIFDALANGWDQIGGGAGAFGMAPLKGFTAADYQRANNAISNIAQSYLYAVSGQAAPAGEVAKIVNQVTPTFGENPKAVQDKKARLKQFVDAIALGQKPGDDLTAGGPPAADAGAGGTSNNTGTATKVVPYTDFF